MKVNFYSKTLPYILFFYFIIIDSINGYLQDTLNIYTPIGLICRGIVFIFVIRFLFYRKNDILFKTFNYTLFVYVIALSVWMICIPDINYFLELQYMFKFIYFFAILSYFYIYQHSFNISGLCYIITYSSLIIAVLNIFCFITGIGNRSYGEDFGFGVKAFYVDGNSLGLYMILSNCISIWLAFSRRKIMYLVAITISIGTLLIGSRTAVGGVILSWLMMLGYVLLFGDKNIIMSRMNKFSLLLVGGSGIIYGLIKAFIFISEVDSYTMEKFTFESAFSARDHLIILGKQIIGNFSCLELLFGKGSTGGQKALGDLYSLDMEFKSMESDWYDMILYFGWFFGGIMIALMIIIFFKLVFVFFKCPSALSLSLFIIALLWIGTSWMAGHAFNNTMLAPLFGTFYVIANKIKKEK